MKHQFGARLAFVLGMLAGTFPLSVDSTFAQSSMPSSTVANYGDWTVRCRNPEPSENESAGQICEMVTLIRVQTPQTSDANGNPVAAQSRVLAQVALGRVPDTEGLKAVVQVPSGIWLREPLTLAFGESSEALDSATDTNKLSMSYFRCAANYCLADFDMDTSKLESLKSAQASRISFTDGARRTINVPVSMNGFASALTGMDAN